MGVSTRVVKRTQYKGVRIWVTERRDKYFVDYAYETSNGVWGSGQSSVAEAVQTAKRAIKARQAELDKSG